MSLATRRKALPQSRCMLPGSWWHTDWQISNFEVWFKLLQAGQGILWIRISRRRSCILRAELLCRVQNADLVGRHHQAERERKVQHGTTSWTSLQGVCNPLTLKPQALSHQLCLSQGLDMSTDQHHPQSSTIIHNHPVSEGKATALWWVVQLLPSPGKCDRAKPWTALHILHEYARISWHNSESSANPGTVMICDDAWSILKRSELPLTRLSRRWPPWSLHQDLQSTPERLESFWIFWLPFTYFTSSLRILRPLEALPTFWISKYLATFNE